MERTFNQPIANRESPQFYFNIVHVETTPRRIWRWWRSRINQNAVRRCQIQVLSGVSFISLSNGYYQSQGSESAPFFWGNPSNRNDYMESVLRTKFSTTTDTQHFFFTLIVCSFPLILETIRHKTRKKYIQILPFVNAVNVIFKVCYQEQNCFLVASAFLFFSQGVSRENFTSFTEMFAGACVCSVLILVFQSACLGKKIFSRS